MNVKIAHAGNGRLIDAEILDFKKVKGINLPSITDGWRFNFRQHSRKRGYETYIVVCKESPKLIEGCLIFEMKGGIQPFMAYIEIAPHNKGGNRMFDLVAGCLIAFACRQSFMHGLGDYKGWLAFDVMEEHKADEVKLMALYSQRYGALRFGETTMVIPPEGGEKLINEYLKK